MVHKASFSMSKRGSLIFLLVVLVCNSVSTASIPGQYLVDISHILKFISNTYFFCFSRACSEGPELHPVSEPARRGGPCGLCQCGGHLLRLRGQTQVSGIYCNVYSQFVTSAFNAQFNTSCVLPVSI